MNFVNRLPITALAMIIVLMISSAKAGTLSCAAAGAVVERESGLPPGLLDAIGHVESGRYDPQSGHIVAWPWAINAQGQGRYYDSPAAAIAAVQALQMAGIWSIDVGCFQINLASHADAFITLEDAFDPESNARAAAQFLISLHDRTGSWEMAVAWYHSAIPGVGEPYRDRVFADWQGDGLQTLPASFHIPPLKRRSGVGDVGPGSLMARIGLVSRAFGITVWAPAAADVDAGHTASAQRDLERSRRFRRLSPMIPNIITP
jgi:hypothetical protein